ncbi:MAG TPA: hypothetical protein VFP59_19370 [Candidatus Angelobacter sp.]|nr:hypothetical protein [Candidatus Angelobacter sp.]
MVLGVALPLTMAVILIASRQSQFLSHINGTGTLVRFGHIAFCLLSSVALPVFGAFQVLSGYQGNPGSLHFYYQSIFCLAVQWVVNSRPAQVGAVVLSGTVYLYAKMAFEGKEPPQYLKKYLNKAVLADLSDDLRPRWQSGWSSFNISVAPELPLIRRLSNGILREYQRRIPGSLRAAEYVTSILRECEADIKELLLDEYSRTKWRVELYPGTSRAMDATLAGFPAGIPIITSPFEHPSELAVAKWGAILASRQIHPINLKAKDIEERWEFSKVRVLNELTNTFQQVDSRAILIVSDVFYATGHKIPLEELINGIRSEIRSRLFIVIDGAHSPGNGGRLKLPLWAHAYVCSAHKWLLCPEPCGLRFVQLTDRNPAYDVWDDAVPISTGSAQMIASLHACLRVWREFGPDSLFRRSQLLKELFLSQAKDLKVQVVGSGNGLMETSVVSICPKLAGC